MVKTMNELEQLEFQREHPELYTTLSQSVNADGTITTYDDVTKHLRAERDRVIELRALHEIMSHHDAGCKSASDLRELLVLLDRQLTECKLGFVKHYVRMFGDPQKIKDKANNELH